MEQKEILDAAAVAAEVNNAANNAAEVANAVAAETLLGQVLKTDKGNRGELVKTFGRHWSGSQSLAVIKKGAEDTLKDMAKFKTNLEALLQEIAEKEATARLQTVAEGADSLSADEIQQMIQLLEAAKAKKAS